MKLLSSGTAHWLWARLLVACGSPQVARVPIAALGLARWTLFGKTRRDIKRWYGELAEVARREGREGKLTQTAPRRLTRQHFCARPLLGVAPVLATAAPDGYLERLYVDAGFDDIEEAVKLGLGLLSVGTHFGSMGITVAMLARHGHDVLILRDKQFCRYKDTIYEKNFFLGARALFLDHDDPTSDTKVILACARHLRAGGVLAYTLDGSHGSHIYDGLLLNRQVQLRTALIELAVRCKTPVLGGFSFVKKGQVHFNLPKPQVLTSAGDVEAWCAQLCREWEGMLLEHPESMSWSGVDLSLIGRKRVRKISQS